MLLHRLNMFAFVAFTLAVASGDIFKDFLNGLRRARKYSTIFNLIDGRTLHALESVENEAATFICQLAKGDIPSAISGLEDDIIHEVQTEWKSLKSFVKGLPDVVPDLIDSFEEGAIDVADAVSGLVDNPESEASVLWHDFTSDVSSAWKGLTCDVEEFFGGQCSQSSSASRVWKTKCASVTTAVPSGVPPSTTAYATAKPTAAPSSAYPVSTRHPSRTLSLSSSCFSSADRSSATPSAHSTWETSPGPSQTDERSQTSADSFAAAASETSAAAASSSPSPGSSTSDSEFDSGANNTILKNLNNYLCLFAFFLLAMLFWWI